MFSIQPAGYRTKIIQLCSCALLTFSFQALAGTTFTNTASAESNRVENDQEIITHSTPAQKMQITLNQITLVKLNDKISDALIGNPAIADITIQNSSSFIITGKSYGRTNIILLNKEGETIFNKFVYVDDDKQNVVRIQRGTARVSYTCTPNCQPTPTIGDDPKHLKAVSGNLKTKLKTINSAIK